MNGPRDLPVTTSRFALLMFVGVPMNIGLGSLSFSSSLSGPCPAWAGASMATVSIVTTAA